MGRVKKGWLIISVVFYVGMLILTFTARSIHERNLPHVTVSYLEQELFPSEYMDENGELQMGLQSRTAIPKKLTEQPIFVVYKAIKNGEERDFVREVQILTGIEENGYLEVISGIGYNERVVVSTSAELTDGAEVVIQ